MIKNLFLIKRTLPNAWGFGQPNAGFIIQFYRKALEVMLVSKYGKSLKTITLDLSKNYLFIYSPWFGYFSWITESLPRIYEVEKNHKSLTLILPESYSNKKFVRDSLNLFPDLKFEIIPEGVHMKIPRVTIPELKPFTYIFDPETMISFRQKVWDHVDQLDIKIDKRARVYVSRNKAKNRKITNNSEVVAIFQNYDFQEVEFENYNFFEQVYMMKHCKVLAGVHGAGFANVAFMSEKSVLFELIKEYSSPKEERPSYWRLCSSLNIDYYIQYCQPKSYGNYDLWVGIDLIVNTELLTKNLDLISND